MARYASDGGRDKIASLDAFKISHHPDAIPDRRWLVAPLTPWAREIMLDSRCPSPADFHGTAKLAPPAGFAFPRVGLARDWIRAVERAAADWWKP